MSGGLLDSRGRVARKLRISVTDRCNFSCLFCMPQKDKIRWLPKDDILTYEEITRIVRTLVSMGIEKIRVTGGEPLMRQNLEELISSLKSIDGVKSLDMTTNAWFLEGKAQALKDAGLRGVTVSLHSLKRERFARISGMDALPRVLRGIDRALEVGLRPVKINSVAMAGYNDDEILDLVEFAREKEVALRFIEFMPLDGMGAWSPDRMLTGKRISEIVSERYRLVPRGRELGDTASLYGFEDGRGELGLIMPMSQPFCDDCDRIRLTADGKLLSCLFDTAYNDLKQVTRNGGSDSELADYIRKCVYRKPAGVAYMPWVKKFWEKPRAMYAIGG
ncbi:MAG: GTP 3',8-cyclase MoaA [Nitrososphaerota archaeon]|nr:GTP 3',8-cyclase MoaA [Nitrososphaerota archaeon]MDG6939170.1 GTP 3',8-cyclase MoaA [Nitrososphaerota archaeon]